MDGGVCRRGMRWVDGRAVEVWNTEYWREWMNEWKHG